MTIKDSYILRLKPVTINNRVTGTKIITSRRCCKQITSNRIRVIAWCRR